MITKDETIVDVWSELRDKPIGKMLPSCIEDARGWMSAIYTDVDFYNLHLISLRPFNPQGLAASYNMAHKDIIVTDVPYTWFNFYGTALKAIRNLNPYAKAPSSWRESENNFIGFNDEGQRKRLMMMLIHEMTHHVQYERGFHEGNEVDTALSELYWLQENDDDAFTTCFTKVMPEGFEPPTIRRRRRGEPLPWYLKNSGRNHPGFSRY